jgi:hypothetical protein
LITLTGTWATRKSLSTVDKERLTLAMFPVLLFMHVRLARAEEREALAEFGDA